MSVVYTAAPRTDEAQGRSNLARFENGELDLDVDDMRDTLARKGLTYKPYGP